MEKAFLSEITINRNQQHDTLYDLFKVAPAKPITINHDRSSDCDFKPQNDKYYLTKKKSRQKVKTVRDIRNMFEKDMMIYLPTDLEKQQNYLLRKIKNGLAKENKTRQIARSMINSNAPISKASWQMLMNINPEDKRHSSQYFLFNGKFIRVGGSRGGDHKLISISNKNENTYRSNKKPIKKMPYSIKKGLLRNSLLINFKPGPLTRKKQLDNSYQKYSVGKVEVVDLPTPSLEIKPTYGTVLDTTISNHLHNFREIDGVISKKWAEFSVSVLGKVNGSDIDLCDNESMKFHLLYQSSQRRTIMRRDMESISETTKNKIIDFPTITAGKGHILPEVRQMVKEIIDSIEINLSQDTLLTFEEERTYDEEKNSDILSVPKEKNKRKFCELNRLDVTVITLSDNSKKKPKVNECLNSYCTFGCICDSLQCNFQFKPHCGRIDCMFKCKCHFSKYAVTDNLDIDHPELLPGLLKLDNAIKSNLCKEEQKFQRTVIVTDDKSVLLKSKKRQITLSKKYSEESNSTSCNVNKSKLAELSIVAVKLNCKNIEPWCMVHNLYKCFCKGRFVETGIIENNEKKTEFIERETLETDKTVILLDDNNDDDTPTIIIETENCTETKDRESKTRSRKERHTPREIEEHYSSHLSALYDNDSKTCRRVRHYSGRKCSVRQYSNINMKVRNLERNDKSLQKRLLYLIEKCTTADNVLKKSVCHETEIIDCESDYENTFNPPENDKQLAELTLNTEINEEINKNHFTFEDASERFELLSRLEMVETSTDKRIANKPKLVSWLESSYQVYKRRLELGIKINTLEAPKKGKVVLYPWDFVLKRYSERKNLFLISKQSPYRIFMAVDDKNPNFTNCINIDDIRFSELYNYPATVKNLLTNKSGLKENFCIMFGLCYCWELVGSVMKMNDRMETDMERQSTVHDLSLNEIINADNILSDTKQLNKTNRQENSQSTFVKNIFPDSEHNIEPLDTSKWFVMTIENDFSEIQFYRKGFFVKYDSIIAAINVARLSEKTVRLSSQKCADKSSGPQFGIYAIPNANEYCVFVGPYECDEGLGIETVKTTFQNNKQKTRGVWIITNKIDNSNVIDNPLSFMPLEIMKHDAMLPKETDAIQIVGQCNLTLPSKRTIDNSTFNKTSKTIRIPRGNKFFKLAPKSHKSSDSSKLPIIISTPTKNSTSIDSWSSVISSNESLEQNDVVQLPVEINLSTDINLQNSTENNAHHTIASKNKTFKDSCDKSKKPVAEVAPQIKIAAVYSETQQENQRKPIRPEKGMFILKPEEINEKIISLASNSSGPSKKDGSMEMDIEDFLDSHVVCGPTETETFIISDDEETVEKDILINCKSVEDLGMIAGKVNQEGEIKFEFPGFKTSNYYTKELAFQKINQVLSRKIYIPPELVLEWEVVKKMEDIKLLKKEELSFSMLSPDILQINDVKPSTSFKTYTRKPKPQTDEGSAEAIGDFQLASNLLEEESTVLWSKTCANKRAIANAITKASDEDRSVYTSALYDILTNRKTKNKRKSPESD